MKHTRKNRIQSAPTCVFCHRSGDGIQFVMFSPRFKPFGTACLECETTLPEGTTVPETTAHVPQK